MKAENKAVYKDHLGNEYASEKEMCKHYNMSQATYSYRKRMGWSIEKILTTPVRKRTTGCEDHLGRKYRNQAEMCEVWGITINTYQNRLKLKWPLEEILTTVVKRTKSCVDHKGNEYDSVMKMCEAWGIGYTTFSKRRQQGWNLEKALSKSVTKRAKIFVDHEGNTYENKLDMCNAWGIKVSTYNGRIKLGWSIEEALTSTGNPTEYIVFGTRYNEIKQIASAWKISSVTLTERMNRGINLLVAVLVPSEARVSAVKGINDITWYKVLGVGDNLYSGRQIVELYHPDLLEAYDKFNGECEN